jgi:hypothetical protein
MFTDILLYTVLGLIFLFMVACAFGPLLIDEDIDNDQT